MIIISVKLVEDCFQRPAQCVSCVCCVFVVLTKMLFRMITTAFLFKSVCVSFSVTMALISDGSKEMWLSCFYLLLPVLILKKLKLKLTGIFEISQAYVEAYFHVSVCFLALSCMLMTVSSQLCAHTPLKKLKRTPWFSSSGLKFPASGCRAEWWTGPCSVSNVRPGFFCEHIWKLPLRLHLWSEF